MVWVNEDECFPFTLQSPALYVGERGNAKSVHFKVLCATDSCRDGWKRAYLLWLFYSEHFCLLFTVSGLLWHLKQASRKPEKDNDTSLKFRLYLIY